MSKETAEIAAPRRSSHWLYVLWALPVSVWAIFLLPLALYRARWALNQGVLEITSPGLSWFLRGIWFRALAGSDGFAAATIGHVVIARDGRSMTLCRAHEYVHVRQCERWGVFFPVAYVVAGLLAVLRTKNWASLYGDNPFELEAEEVSAACMQNSRVGTA